jgi:hypothetical protein
VKRASETEKTEMNKQEIEAGKAWVAQKLGEEARRMNVAMDPPEWLPDHKHPWTLVAKVPGRPDRHRKISRRTLEDRQLTREFRQQLRDLLFERRL